MKHINWVVMSALVMGISAQAMQDTEDVNPYRKKRVSPCCNLTKYLTSRPAALLLGCAVLFSKVQGANAQGAERIQANAGDPQENSSGYIPASFIHTQALVQAAKEPVANQLKELPTTVRCWKAEGYLNDGNQFEVQTPLCHRPATDAEFGRMQGHIERQLAGPALTPTIKQMLLTESQCDVNANEFTHQHSIKCIKGSEYIKGVDVRVY